MKVGKKFVFSVKSSKKWIQLRNIKGSIQIRINLKGRIRIHIKQKKRIRIQIRMTKWRGSATAVVLNWSAAKAKISTGKCFGNPTSWWPAAGPAQRQCWWRSTPSCSAASDQWPGPVRSTSPAEGQRVHMCSSKSKNNINNKRRSRSGVT